MDIFTICLTVGAIIVVFKMIEVIKRVLPYFTAPLDINDRYIKGQKDVWAVVTGASEGIGRDLSIQLSNKGFNIILIARTISKLEETAKLLNPKVQYKILSKDISKCNDESFMEDLKKELSQYKIGALINNAAVIYVERFIKLTPEQMKQQIKVNMIGTSLMTSNLIEKMYVDAKNDKRKTIIVHLSSISAEAYYPYYQIYSATKRYIYYFATSLRQTYQLYKGDYKDYIDFLVLRPYFVKTQMVSFKTDPFTASTDQFVKSAINLFGKVDDANGFILHEIFSIVTSSVPKTIQEFIIPILSWRLVKKFGFNID